MFLRIFIYRNISFEDLNQRFHSRHRLVRDESKYSENLLEDSFSKLTEVEMEKLCQILKYDFLLFDYTYNKCKNI